MLKIKFNSNLNDFKIYFLKVVFFVDCRSTAIYLINRILADK